MTNAFQSNAFQPDSFQLESFANLAGASAGASTSTAYLTLDVGLSGASAGPSTADAALSLALLLQGASSALSATSASLLVPPVQRLYGSAHGASSATGQITGGTIAVSLMLLGAGPALSLNSGSYAVDHSTLLELEAGASHDPVLVQMQNRHPVFLRARPVERTISLVVHLLAKTYQQRRNDYETMASALASLSDVATLQWTDNNGMARQYQVVVLSISPDAWFNRATATLIAPNPYAAQVA